LGCRKGALAMKTLGKTKLTIGCVVVAALIATPAMAADLPMKTPAPVAVPYDPWTGFYVGGSIGARWSDVQWLTQAFDRPEGVTPGNIDNPARLDSVSARAGGYLGYNFKIASNWLVGVEGDIAWGNSSKTVTPFPGAQIDGTVAGDDFVTAKLGWDGSLRARLGILLNPNWLLFGTGGAAWQEVKTISICINGNGFCGDAGLFTGTTSSIKPGWTLGGGLEAALGNNWLARIEYRYADFGNVTNILPPAPIDGITSSVSIKTSTLLAGLAYKF
jgi:outer membrane immunogenic protein